MMKYTPYPGIENAPWRNYEFYHTTRQRAEQFMKNMVLMIPDRVRELERFVSSSPGYEDWRADGSEASFLRLGTWLRTALKFRKMTMEELKKYAREYLEGDKYSQEDVERVVRNLKESDLAESLHFEDKMLARSVTLDIGLYTASCLQALCPQAEWRRRKGKRSSDENHPYLEFPYGAYCPVKMSRGCARCVCIRGEIDAFLDNFRVHGAKARKTEDTP